MDSEPPSSDTAQMVDKVILFLLTPLIWYLGNEFPSFAHWIGGSLLVLGMAALLTGMLYSSRYKHVFDYEPALFLGRPTNGKQVRARLSLLGAVGGWLALGGLLVWIF